MSLVPKMDEVQEVVRSGNYLFISLVETWLQNHLHDHVTNMLLDITLYAETESMTNVEAFAWVLKIQFDLNYWTL